MRLFLLIVCLGVATSCEKAESPPPEPVEVRLDARTPARYFYFGEQGVTGTTDYTSIPELARAGVFVTLPGRTSLKEGEVLAVVEDDQGLKARVEPRFDVALRAYITQRPMALAASITEEARVIAELTPGSQALEAEREAREQVEAKLGGPTPFERAGIAPEDLMRQRRQRWARVRVPQPADFGLEP